MDFRHALLGAIALACASCTVTTHVEKDAVLAPADSIFVIGSSPDHFRIETAPCPKGTYAITVPGR